jgi:hypothetical protein
MRGQRQALRIIEALPPKALLHYGYKGKIYHNPGVANDDVSKGDHRHGPGSVRGEEDAALRPLYLVSVSR